MGRLRDWFQRWIRPKPQPDPVPPVPPAPPPDPVPPTPSTLSAEVVRFTNLERAKRRTDPLAVDARITAAAQAYADKMAAADELTHTLHGETFLDRLRDSGVDFKDGSEVIGWNQDDPAGIVDSWMDSSGHRRAILDPEFDAAGAGVANRGKGNYWCMILAKL